MPTIQSPPPHVVIFPYMAQGHTLPLLDISKALACRGVKVTIITTPSNAPLIRSKTCNHSEISLSIVPFPKVQELPEGCENTADLPSMDLIGHFLFATKMLKQPFEDILSHMFKVGHPPICVISDAFLGWTFNSCNSFGIPRIVSHGMGVLPMAIAKSVSRQVPCMAADIMFDSDSIQLPNLRIPFPLSKQDIPLLLRSGNPDSDLFSSAILEAMEAEEKSWGVIVNSFEELEGDHVTTLESLYQKDAKAWCVGPVSLYDDHIHHHGEYESCDPNIKWLDDRSTYSVMYISFGTQARLRDEQMDEIAMGLEMADQEFIWVVKSQTWSPPHGWEERVKGKGLIVRDWVEQRSILAHKAIGGCLSHCGWNSVLESLSMGVPLLAWPMGAEQPLNAKYLAMGLGAGILMIPQGSGLNNGEKMVSGVDRYRICEGVKELMEGEKGRKARERAQELGTMARLAIQKGGSSYRKLDELIECLKSKQPYMQSQN